MNLLRRPLRPRLRPLLLNDIAADGKTELLSPLSSVSSSTSDSAITSRATSHTRSPRYLPPLEEDSHHVSLVTPFQSEHPAIVDQLTIAMYEEEQRQQKDDDDDDEQDDDDEENQRQRSKRPKRARVQLAPLKTREYSQFSVAHRPVVPTKVRTLNRTPKYKGPAPLPARRTRSFHDAKSQYSQISDDDAYAIANQFTFNDFILHSSVSRARHYEECTLERAILSKYTYKQICEMIAEQVWAERGEGGKVCEIDNTRVTIAFLFSDSCSNTSARY